MRSECSIAWYPACGNWFNCGAASAPQLRILLSLLALDAAAGALMMLFSGKGLIMRLFPYRSETEITTLLLVMRREWGALALTLSLMFCLPPATRRAKLPS